MVHAEEERMGRMEEIKDNDGTMDTGLYEISKENNKAKGLGIGQGCTHRRAKHTRTL
jgi:hypothetical protein